MYEHKHRTLDNLKEAILVEVSQVDRAMLKEEAIFQEHLQKCINENGHHTTDVVFHT